MSNEGVILKATNNYWGVETGPGAPPDAPDKVCNRESFASTTTSPFATKPFAVNILKP